MRASSNSRRPRGQRGARDRPRLSAPPTLCDFTADDFLCTNPKGVDGPRQPDGNLPDIAFLRPKPGSRLIDAGINIELPFKGSASDLGAFEIK